MIRKISIEGFKSMPSLELELGRVNCFIGANGVGKSNILEAVGVLGAAARGRVDDEALIRRGVRPSVPRLYRTSFAESDTPDSIGLGVDAEDGAAFRVLLRPPQKDDDSSWSFVTESLSLQGKVEIERESDNGNSNQNAGMVAARRFDIAQRSPTDLLIQTLESYSIYSPNTPMLRGVVPDPQTRKSVGLAGGGLADGLDDLFRELFDKQPEEDSAEDAELYDGVLGLLDWVSDLRPTPNAKGLVSRSVPRAELVIEMTDRFMHSERNRLSAYDASEGALYILFAAILCLVRGSPPLFAIDNLDQALNPRLATRLASNLSAWLMRGGADRQLLFTTHNPAVLDGLDLADDQIRLFAVDRNTLGQTCCRRIEPSPRLLALNKEYPLSRLWLMGRLGAVPNV